MVNRALGHIASGLGIGWSVVALWVHKMVDKIQKKKSVKIRG